MATRALGIPAEVRIPDDAKPGKLDEVIHHARTWFLKHLQDVAPRETRDDRPHADFR